MSKLCDKKKINLMMLLFATVYFTSYISRINFGAVIEGIDGFTKDELSLAPTVAFITYGVGQLVSGVLGDRFNPKYLMCFGLLLTAAMNTLIPFCADASQMAAVWAVNGFAQSFMWPPLVKIMTILFDDDTYRTATVKVNRGSSIGTIAIYIVSFICLNTIGWKGVFAIPAIACLLMVVIWLYALRNVDTSVSKKKRDVEKSDEGMEKKHPFTLFALVAIVIGIVSQGALRDGITTWMPTFVNDNYNLGEAISILTGVILPIFSIICFNITLWLRNNKVRNEILLAGYIFVAGVMASVLLYISLGVQPILSVFLMAVLAGSMHGVNLILVCMVPSYFKNASTASGVLNAFTYIGSAISTYGIAFISKNYGWNITIAIWIGVAALGTVACLIAAKRKKPQW